MQQQENVQDLAVLNGLLTEATKPNIRDHKWAITVLFKVVIGILNYLIADKIKRNNLQGEI